TQFPCLIVDHGEDLRLLGTIG
ncbi:uncharacterized protein METZ01_LOCUS143375, partial [marine metagenome]